MSSRVADSPFHYPAHMLIILSQRTDLFGASKFNLRNGRGDPSNQLGGEICQPRYDPEDHFYFSASRVLARAIDFARELSTPGWER